MNKKRLLFVLPLLCLMGGFVLLPKHTQENVCVIAGSQEDAQTFISYWQSEIRGTYPDICTMPKEKYNELYLKYVSLSPEARQIVDNTTDVDGYTIKDTMNVLIKKFNQPSDDPGRFTFSKSTTLTIIIVVGVLGMTSICGLYFMKTKNVIQ